MARRWMRMALLAAAAIVGPISDGHAIVARVSCRDGARCDLDKTCDGACLMRICGTVTAGPRICGRHSANGLEAYPSQLVAAGTDRQCEHGTCQVVRCRRAAKRCKPVARSCTFALGSPFDRQFGCRVTLGRAAADPGGFLFLTAREGSGSAIGLFELPSAASGHYEQAEGEHGYVNMSTLPGFDSWLTAYDYQPGTGFVADVTLDSEFDGGVGEVRGNVQGTFTYGSPGVLVPFSIEF
jgi:hypothetical protein